MTLCVHLKRLLLLVLINSFLVNHCDNSNFKTAEVFGPNPVLKPTKIQRSYQYQSSQDHRQPSAIIKDPKPSFQPPQIPNVMQQQLQATTPAPVSAEQVQPPTDLGIYPPLQNGQTNVPLYLYNPGLARKIGLSTLMMGGVLYSLSVIPALLALSGSAPFAGLLGSLGKRRKRRSSFLDYRKRYYFREMPYMNKDSTVRILSMLENTLEMRKIDTPVCKKHFLCKIYRKAILSEDEPLTLATFERAIIDTFGVAAERKNYRLDLIPTVKSYYEASIVGITGSNCTRIYPCTKKAKIANVPKIILTEVIHG